MSFTDQKLFIVTEQDTQKRWGGGFWCKLCGHVFMAGDTARWIYANGRPNAGTGGNFFVCGKCDADDQTCIDKARREFELAITLAKRWRIYGPDWERELVNASQD